MRYPKMLLKIIGDASYSEIANKCEKIGVHVTKSNISKMVTGQIKEPSQDVLRAIAKVCNKDERLLVIESALDNVPDEIFDAFFSLKFAISLFCSQIFSNLQSKKLMEDLRIALKEETMSEFIISLIDNDIKNYDFSKTGLEVYDMLNNLILKLGSNSGLEVNDDSMEPLIKKNSNVELIFQNNYNDGDIIMINIKKTNKKIVGMLFKKDTKILLTFLNKKYSPIEYSNNSISILGKVSKTITEI